MDIKELATSAHRLDKKCSKRTAYNLIKGLATNEITGGDADKAYAELYKWFMPPVPAKPKTDEQWVAKALAVKDVRYYLNNLYVNSGDLAATDGHRLHLMTGTDYGDGFYDKTMQSIDDNARYPDVSRVIPKFHPCDTLDSMPSDWTVLEHSNRLVYELPECAAYYFNKKHIDEAFSGFDTPLIYLCDDGTKVVVSEDNKLAVIMGITRCS